MGDDSELNALIVRNIGDIEAAFDRATGAIDTRTWQAIADVAESAMSCEDGWLGEFDINGDIVFYPEEWRDSEGKPECYFQIDEIKGEGKSGEGQSWLGDVVGESSHGAYSALIFEQEIVKGKALSNVANRTANLRERLRQIGFQEKHKKLHLPFRIPKETLAQAFAEGNFDDAMVRLTEAIAKIIESRPTFDEMVATFRAV
jgi:hypothetical protein